MRVLIKSVEIRDAGSKYNKQVKNVLLDNGVIVSIDDNEAEADQVIDGQGMLLSQGWFDLRANFNDPGLEFKEDLESGANAAKAGGFTDVLLLPNTEPVIDSKNEVNYVTSRNRSRLTQLHVAAAVTKGAKGEDFTDIVDLHHQGALAFTDGEKPLYNSDILLKALQYLQKFDGVLMNRPSDKYLSMFGQMHEGHQSTMLGMKGIPSMAEELMVIRDLKLLEYAGGGKLHFSNLSTKESVDLIRKAKKDGLNVTCDIASHQLLFDDSQLVGFDTNYKVDPPFRSTEDIEALKVGLKDGTIDAVVSSHTPHDQECKQLEFDLADFGVIGLQTVYSSLKQAGLDDDLIVEKLVEGPRRVLGLENMTIEEGKKLSLTLFDPEANWTFDASTNKSKANNSPLFGKELKGRAKAVVNNGQVEELY
ncbi:dihydroorotase [Aureibacter tunicatorum]|uniref:Dihydroorotase n=1 Tax=Aureibacter tunicatorum TaxID=866807 RepID=A0AAE3XRG8_9BACT|nr:dihydroorotase [Aureibacter tunicatorum]MDR6241325.1 dihydroorotase [Aureibacter tunicatorum]BDD03584.1 dihydroorotase [Aureibacter tunicatorum]